MRPFAHTPSIFTNFLTACFVSLMVLVAPASAQTLEWNLEATSTGQIPEPVPGGEQTGCLVADFDGDGVLDVVIAERSEGPSVAILFRTDTGWNRTVLEDQALPIEAGGAVADIDGDGDLDFAFGGDYRSNDVWWWENPGSRPYTSDWARHVIKSDGSLKHHDVMFADVDDDGALEFVFWNQNAGNTLFLAEIPADPRSGPWPRTAIFELPDVAEAEGLAAADIDGDGDLDIAGAGYWLEHTSGSSFTPHQIVAGRAFTRTVVGQLVPGGRPEVVIVPGDASGRLAWYEWNGSAWTENVLDDLVEHGHSLELGDVDADGNLDIFVAEMHTPGAGDQARARIFLGDGTGAFDERRVSTGIGYHQSRLADMDGDGILDVVGKPFMTGAPAVNCWIESNLTATDAPSSPARAGLLREVGPNPFNARLTIEVELDRAAPVELTVYDASGRHVRTLAPGDVLAAGSHDFVWTGVDDTGRTVASGTYLLRATSPTREDVRSVVLVK